MLRPVAAFVGAFVVVIAVLLAAVGQLGKINRQALVAVLVASVVAASVAAWRARRRS